MFKFTSRLAVAVIVSAMSFSSLQADPVGGPTGSVARVDAFCSYTFTLDCHGGEWTGIRIVGDGDTDLDLYVYDCYGNLIGSAESCSDIEELMVLPHFRQNLTIKVVNLGSVYNEFSIRAW